jgi:hypothetical protein
VRVCSILTIFKSSGIYLATIDEDRGCSGRGKPRYSNLFIDMETLAIQVLHESPHIGPPQILILESQFNIVDQMFLLVDLIALRRVRRWFNVIVATFVQSTSSYCSILNRSASFLGIEI